MGPIWQSLFFIRTNVHAAQQRKSVYSGLGVLTRCLALIREPGLKPNSKLNIETNGVF